MDIILLVLGVTMKLVMNAIRPTHTSMNPPTMFFLESRSKMNAPMELKNITNAPAHMKLREPVMELSADICEYAPPDKFAGVASANPSNTNICSYELLAQEIMERSLRNSRLLLISPPSGNSMEFHP